jgi:hypothetical protein
MDYCCTSENKYLLFSSIGDMSALNHWLDADTRDYDIVVAYYGDDDDYFEKISETNSEDFKAIKRKGLKWPQFNWYVENHDVSKYKYIWIPDDDIELNGDGISRMFGTLEEYPNIMAASPSTTYSSVNSGGQSPRHDRHICKRVIEYRDAVECGLTLIKTDLLDNEFFRKILSIAKSGFWFDRLLNFCFDAPDRSTSQAILHQIIARHPLRPNKHSEINVAFPRHLHIREKETFIKEGIPTHMFNYGWKGFENINQTDECICRK